MGQTFWNDFPLCDRYTGISEERLPDFQPKQRRRLFSKIWKCTERGTQVKTVILHFDFNSLCHLNNNNIKSWWI